MESYLTSLFGLAGKTALITGGTRGIGSSLTLALASAGANIILLARNIEAGVSVLDAVRKVGRTAFIYPCDLSSRQDIQNILPTLIENGHEVDIFIHCAGLQHRSPAEDFEDRQWDEIIGVNLTAGFQIARDLAKNWFNTSLKDYTNASTEDRRKKIVFIASITSFVGSTQIPAYTASKGAVAQLTKALNNEWMAKGINVNAIAPGYIETELTSGIRDGGEKELEILKRTPAGRWGQTGDLDGAVVHLCARSGDYIGGEVHIVDGGYLGR